MFGSLWAIADEGGAVAATLVTTGVAVSVVHDYAVTLVGLVVYVVVVASVIALINID
jgi:hypothetical protein